MPDTLTFLQPQHRAALAASGLVTLDDFLANRAGDLVSGHGITHTRRVTFGTPADPALPAQPSAVLPDGAQPRAAALVGYLKTYDYTRRPLRHRFIRDKARREADNFDALRQRCGFTVPVVVCFGARRCLGALVRSFILTLEVPSARPLAMVWDESPSVRDELLHTSPGFVAQMHAAGFVHIDLQWRNLLVQAAPGRRPEWVPLDCSRGGVQRSRIALEHGRLRDLSSLYKGAQTRLSRSQMLRWYLAYLSAQRGTASTHRLARDAMCPRLDGLQREAIRAILRDRDAKDKPPT